MKARSVLIAIILLSAVAGLHLGCRSSQEFKTIQGDPERLYREGLSLFNRRNYVEALKKFEELKSSYPDSPPYTIWAELKVGDCHFLEESYVEAIAAYEEFKKVHPTHEEMPYVQYQIGMSYFNQMAGFDRDQSPTKKALSSFEYLVANYPPSLFTEKAKGKIEACRKQLAEQELYIGNFYYGRGDYLAAARRFGGLLEQYPDTIPEDRTLFLLGKSYFGLNNTEMAKKAFSRLVADFPSSSYVKEARLILDRIIPGRELAVQNALIPGSAGVESTVPERVEVSLIKYEEEGRQPLPLAEEGKPQREGGDVGAPSTTRPGRSSKPDEPLKIGFIPAEEQRRGIPPEPKPKTEHAPGEAAQKAPGPVASAGPRDAEKRRQEMGAMDVLGREKILDSGQPIDITSDTVESYFKDNLIVFKGNVTARQKDMVIYADSIEAVIIQDGKGIEKVVADGNVKVQQGLRVANCGKAVFYNLDKKVVLTGDPKLWEGDNMVSGEMIVFDIEQNRVDVKGGPGGRGKARIQQ
jgi:outer membrane protein assembly factor BamD